MAYAALALSVNAVEGRKELNTGLCNTDFFLPPPLLARAKATTPSISPQMRDFFSMWLSLSVKNDPYATILLFFYDSFNRFPVNFGEILYPFDIFIR